MKLRQLGFGCRAHPEHKQGCVFDEQHILPDGICPLLYHAIYPYWLGLPRGAVWDWKDGADLIHCPACAPYGVRCVVDMVAQGNEKYAQLSALYPAEEGDHANVPAITYAEIVEAKRCPRGLRMGMVFIFPNTRKDTHLCPALWYAAFPFMPLPEYTKECCRPERVRCPDWNGHICAEIVNDDPLETFLK